MTGGPDVAVELHDVQKIYGPVRVLNIDELTLYRGQIVALVGENGAGKSTLMGSLAGMVKPDAGRITVLGEDLPIGNPAAQCRADESVSQVVHRRRICDTSSPTVQAGERLRSRLLGSN